MPSASNKIRLITAAELRLSIVLASMATLIVCISVGWHLFFTPTHAPPATMPLEQSVAVTEKPQSLQPAATPALHTQTPPTPHPKKPDPLQTHRNSHQVVIGTGKFFVQVGAFQEVARAKAIYKKMRNTYKRAQIMTKTDYYAVWVGPVRSKAEAEILKKNILKRYQIKGFITTMK